MCGIFGIVFKDHREDLGEILLQAGRRLTYRGYDSVELKKDVGKIEQVNKKYHFEKLIGYKGKVQLRWATFGPPNDSLALNSYKLIPLPSQNYFLCPLLAVIVAQQIAYYVSQKKGISPDQPRNISRTLTVD